MKELISIFALLLTLGLGQSLQAGELEDIIATNIASKGGRAAIDNIESLRIDGKMVMAAMGMEMPFTINVKDRKVLFSANLQGTRIAFGLTPEDSWMIMPITGSMEPQDMPDAQRDEMRQNMDNMAGYLVDYEEKGHEITLLGKEEIEGTECYKLGIKTKAGTEITLYLETESCIEIKSVGQSTGMTGESFEAHTYFSEYQEVAGMMIAHSIATKNADGTLLNEMVLEKIEANVDLDDDFFARPVTKTDGDGGGR